MFQKTFSAAVIFCFFLNSLGPIGPVAYAAEGVSLPAPGSMVNLSPAYDPVIIKGLTVHQDNPFLLDFIVDIGQDHMSGEPLKKEGEKLIKYFLASLAIPDKDVWVNLSPYEKNQMIPEALGQTDMGRDLLEQDYILKQITASLIYPEKDLGKKFWDGFMRRPSKCMAHPRFRLILLIRYGSQSLKKKSIQVRILLICVKSSTRSSFLAGTKTALKKLFLIKCMRIDPRFMASI